MKPATFAPAYIGLYPVLAEAARENGYALAVHGTVSRDFDLIAVPWVATPVDADTLIRKLAELISYSLDSTVSIDRLFEPPYMASKPQNRKAWCLPLECGAALDISVVLPISSLR